MTPTGEDGTAMSRGVDTSPRPSRPVSRLRRETRLTQIFHEEVLTMCHPTWKFLRINACRLRSHSVQEEIVPGNGIRPSGLGTPSGLPSHPCSGSRSLQGATAVERGFNGGRNAYHRLKWLSAINTDPPPKKMEEDLRENPGGGGWRPLSCSCVTRCG